MSSVYCRTASQAVSKRRRYQFVLKFVGT